MMNARGCVPCKHPDRGLPPPPPPHTCIYVCMAGESVGGTQHQVLSQIALPCQKFMEDSLSSTAGVGGQQPPALDNIVYDSVYITHILPSNFPGTFNALPCYVDEHADMTTIITHLPPSISSHLCTAELQLLTFLIVAYISPLLKRIVYLLT